MDMRRGWAYMKDRAPILNTHVPTSSQYFSCSRDDGTTNGNTPFCQRTPGFLKRNAVAFVVG